MKIIVLIKSNLNICLIAGILTLTGCSTMVTDAIRAESTVFPVRQSVNPTSTMTMMAPELSETPTMRPSATSTPTATLLPTLTFTPVPYSGYFVDDLASRSYGGGKVAVEYVMSENSYFTRYLISYPSDGLDIYGFMNVPKRGSPPYPVIVAIHGYIDPAIYNTLDYTTRYADALARSGYLVLHPNLRGYPPSDSGDNLFRVGMAIDVLNLIALVKSQAGQPGPLELANPDSIGVWGHSMGGGISLRAITVDPEIKAAVLYGSMSGDEHKNYERIFTYFSNGERGLEELLVPDEMVQRISPINYLERIQAAVSIHHGENDLDVPLEWSLDLCQRLNALGKQVECFTYQDEKHTFNGEGDDLFMQRMIRFFDKVLKNR